MDLRRLRTILATLLLGSAYFSLILQWLWLLLIALPPLIKSGLFDTLMDPSPDQVATIQMPAVETSPILLWLAVSIMVAVLVLTVIVLARLPKAVLATSERVVDQAAQAVIPVVTHHRPLPAKKRRILSRRLRLIIQLVVSILPGAASLFLPAVDDLTVRIIVTIGLALMAFSLSAFLLAWLLKPIATSRTQSPVSRG